MSSKISIITTISDSEIHPNVGDFRLFDRSVVIAIRGLKERTRFMKGIFSYMGFKTTILKYDKPERVLGETKQNYKKLFTLAFDGIFSFSNIPLKIWTLIGSCISFAAFLYVCIIIIQKLFFDNNTPAGYPSLIVIILFLGGIQLISVGIFRRIYCKGFYRSQTTTYLYNRRRSKIT